MAKKQISINQWEKLLGDNTVTVELFKDQEDSPIIEIRKTLPIAEFWSAVDEVVEMCFPTINVGTEEQPKYEVTYMPENYDFALRRIVVSQYANMRLPKDYGSQYDLLYTTPVYSMIYPQINSAQLEDLIEGSRQKIEFRKQSMLSISKTLREMIDNIVKATNGLMDINQEDIKKALSMMTSAESSGEKLMEQAIKEAATKTNNSDTPSPASQSDNVVLIK